MARETDPLDPLVRNAVQGNRTDLDRLLMNHGGLPGPKPNLRLARDVVTRLLGQPPAGVRVVEQLAAMTASDAPSDTPREFLVVVGVVGLGLIAARQKPEQLSDALQRLQPFAEDPRFHVRESVPVALREALMAHADDCAPALQGWMDGYLQAHCVLYALSDSATLQRIRDPQWMIQCLDDAFALVEGAPRSHERTQGYRTLVRTVGQLPTMMAKRFSTEVCGWLASKAGTQVPELREAIAANVDAMRKKGVRMGDLQAVVSELTSSKKPPRDPRSYVGPTRERSTRTGRGKRT